MAALKNPELSIIFDPDLAALLLYRGHPILQATDEGGRIGLWFARQAVAEQQAELSSGRSLVEVGRWSSTIRRLHADYLSPAAKQAIRAQSNSSRP